MARGKKGSPPDLIRGKIFRPSHLPRVKLNQKAAGKLLRVLDRSTDQSKGDSKCSVESLGMVAILYRSQSSTETATVDKYKILELILRHDSVIRDSTAQINQMENDANNDYRSIVDHFNSKVREGIGFVFLWLLW